MARIKLRRDTSANWDLQNPILDLGEPGYVTDTNKIKYGNGVDVWTDLPYFTSDFNGGTINLPLTETANPSNNQGAIKLIGSTTSSNLNVGLLQVGLPMTMSDSNILASFTDNVNSYTQIMLQNKNSGDLASSDFIVNNNTVNGSVYGDFGINSTGFVGTNGPFDQPNQTYLIAAGGQLSIGTMDSHEVRIATNDATRITVDNSGPVTFERYSPVIVSSNLSATAHDQAALIVDGGVGVGEDVVVDGSIYIGRGAVSTNFTAPTIIAKQAGQQFIQAALVNSDNRGSSDWVAYGNNSTESNGWADFGFTGTAFSDPTYSITGPSDGYFFVSGLNQSGQGGNMVLATAGTGTTNDIIFATGGFLSANERMRLINSTGQLWIKTGTSSTSTTTGSLRITGGAGISENLNVGGTINKITLTTPATGATFTIADTKTVVFNRSLTFPNSEGSAGGVLTTDGSGNLSWQSVGTYYVDGVNYSASTSDNYIFVNNDSVSVCTILLPTVVQDGKTFTIKKVTNDGLIVRVNTVGGITQIDGSNSDIDITANYGYLTVVYNSSPAGYWITSSKIT